MTHFDMPWKNLSELFFQEFTALFWPDAYEDIDWRQPIVSLSNELVRLSPRDAVGTRIADKVFKVRLRQGESCVFLIHLEFQNQYAADFAKRMLFYNFLIYKKFDCEVVSMAILGDADPSWRPSVFKRGRWGFVHHLEYPVVKLTDYRDEKAVDLQKDNLFTLAILTHLETLRTRGNALKRAEAKLDLIRQLLVKQYDEPRMKAVFLFIDMMIDLPQDLDLDFIEKLKEETKGAAMDVTEFLNYETSIHRYLKREARREGLQEGRKAAFGEVLTQHLVQKLGPLPDWVHETIEKADEPLLRQWNMELSQFNTQDDLNKLRA